mgnify:CR=1 FL=1
MGKNKQIGRQLTKFYRQQLSTPTMKLNTKPTNTKPKPESFIDKFKDKQVVVTLINGEVFEGRLICNNYNKYDVLLETDSNLLFLPKHGILYMRLVE